MILDFIFSHFQCFPLHYHLSHYVITLAVISTYSYFYCLPSTELNMLWPRNLTHLITKPRVTRLLVIARPPRKFF